MTLPRNTHPLARPELDLGRLEPAKVLHNLSLVFKPSAAQKAERDALLDELQRPGSPSYHRWLQPEEYASRFGARPDDIARASGWLASQGFTVHAPSRLGARVTFTGTVAQVEAAFRTEMHRYSVLGEEHYAMAHAPSVPAELADIVLAIYNAHDFHRATASPSCASPSPRRPAPARTGWRRPTPTSSRPSGRRRRSRGSATSRRRAIRARRAVSPAAAPRAASTSRFRRRTRR